MALENNYLFRLGTPAIAYDGLKFPGHGKRADWSLSGRLTNQGNELTNCGDLLKALALYDKAIAIYPTPVCYYNRGICLSSLNRLVESSESYKKAIDVLP